MIVTTKVRAFVTGATGFVGSHLARALIDRGAEVRALVRPTSDDGLLERLGAERVVGSLEDTGTLARAAAGADVVFHLAAATRARSESEYGRVNATGTRTLIDAVLDADGPRPRRIVYLSSLAASGPCIDGRPVRASDTPRPLTAYGRSKLAGERAVLDAAGRGLETVVVRAPAVYGPGDADLFRFFRMAALGVLPVPRGPTRPVQLLFVEDLAEALIQAAAAPAAHGIYHVAEPRAYAWEEVARMIGRAVGRPAARVVRIPAMLVRAAAAIGETAAGLVGRATIFNGDKALELLAPGWLCETARARAELGFLAPTSLADGLARTAAWYDDHGWLRIGKRSKTES